MRKKASDFVKICDNLERDYTKDSGNKFRYVKNYLELKVGHDYDQLKSIHAEATDEKISEIIALRINLYSVIISTITMCITTMNIFVDKFKMEECKDTAFMVVCLGYLIVVVVSAFGLHQSVGKNSNVGHWQGYVVEAVEDILDNKCENERLKENYYKEIDFQNKLDEKQDVLEIKVDLSDQLFEKLDLIKKATSESFLKKIFKK